MRVFLFARDEAQGSRMKEVLLRQAGFRITGCCGAMAVDWSPQFACGADAVLLDAVLPKLDGYAIAQSIPETPCVLLPPFQRESMLPANCSLARTLSDAARVLKSMAYLESSPHEKQSILAELMQMGFSARARGTRQLCRALEIVLRDEDTLADVRGRIYQHIAMEAHCTADSVERNIRYAIERAWMQGDLLALQARFGYTISEEKGKPTNRAFLAQVAEHIRFIGA